MIVRRVCTASLAVSLRGRFRLLLLADRHSFVICILLHWLNVVGIHMMASLLIRTCHDLLLIGCLTSTRLCCVDTCRSRDDACTVANFVTRGCCCVAKLCQLVTNLVLHYVAIAAVTDVVVAR